ncbi:MAG: hypothetical protein V1682_02755 [Candidatus Omnitrophota bacterium]
MKIAVFAVCLFYIVCPGQSFAQDGTIGHLFDEKSPVKVYVSAVTDESGESLVSVDEFKKSLEDSLNNRRAIDFDTVTDPFGSDIQVSAAIKKYKYLERGPFNPSPGIATTLVDAAATATSNYVEMEVLYTVTDTNTGGLLWSDDVKEYIKRVMTPEESIPLIYDKVTRTFTSQCFGCAHQKETVKGPM